MCRLTPPLVRRHDLHKPLIVEDIRGHTILTFRVVDLLVDGPRCLKVVRASLEACLDAGLVPLR